MDKLQHTIDNISALINKNRESFVRYNNRRLQQAIGKFSDTTLDIFKKIPFFIHINSPDFPGFVDSGEEAWGIWHFEQSEFFQQAFKSLEISRLNIKSVTARHPAVQGLYHIGSLGTLTQSVGSDFDYWVIIEKQAFSTKRYEFLDRKLKIIQKYCRDHYDQQVSFFIHDSEDIKQNNFVPLHGEKISLAPKMLLKEEFYRTCIMIAGKIPLWAVLPPKLKDSEYCAWANKVFASDNLSDWFMDFGNLESISMNELSRGVLWHISKSRHDSVKALIKASMAASYRFGRKEESDLLCDILKQKYLDSSIDDDAMDPYIILFERILKFYHDLNNARGLDLIKLAIFFRLCGYPFVAIPTNAFEKRILGKYIRAWNLDQRKVKKMLAYKNWSESEKNMLEKRLTNGIAYLYNLLMKTSLVDKKISDKAEDELTILKNKTIEYLKEQQGKIPKCSIYLKTRKFKKFIISDRFSKSGSVNWSLFADYGEGEMGKRGKPLYSEDAFFRVMGWIMANQLYIHMFSSIVIDSSFKLFDSLNKEADIDSFYLALQPWYQFSDKFFAKKPFWERMVVLLVCEIHGTETVITKSEFLIKNSWSEIFFDSLYFENIEKNQDKCYKIATKISRYSTEIFQFVVFQFTTKPVQDLTERVKVCFDMLKADSNGGDLSIGKRKPYLDLL